MESMRNIVILKDLPSNLVEEAIIFLKQNQKAKKYEYIDNKSKIESGKEKHKFKDCVTKEAEMIISEYISKVEKNKNNKDIIKLKNKYEKSKKANIIFACLLLISFILNII